MQEVPLPKLSRILTVISQLQRFPVFNECVSFDEAFGIVSDSFEAGKVVGTWVVKTVSSLVVEVEVEVATCKVVIAFDSKFPSQLTKDKISMNSRYFIVINPS